MKRAAATALVSPHRCKRAPEGVCINDQTLERECRSALASMRKKCGTLTGKDPMPPMTTHCVLLLCGAGCLSFRLHHALLLILSVRC